MASEKRGRISAATLVAVTVIFVCTWRFVIGERYTSTKRCIEEDLEYREEMANVVISGTVKVLSPDQRNHGMLKGEVEVKRVFKGDNVVNAVANGIDARTSHKMVMIEGFNDPHICDSQIRKFDTRIFLLNKGLNGELKLNSSIVSLTLLNLDRTDAAVKDAPFKTPKPPVLQSPCETYYCPFSGLCLTNKTTGQPYCRCIESCLAVFAPVCGTDNVTYSNECNMNRASCRKQHRVKVQHDGECGRKDPCENQECNYGAVCASSKDGSSWRCICPEQCHSYGDNIGSIPVCGNNGVDYANMCEMRRDACTKMADIRMKYFGKCEPCDGKTCPEPQVCQLDDQRRPVCKCTMICPNSMAQVCGSDGRTYSNDCIMRREACKLRKDIQELYRGPCSGNNPCNSVKCDMYKECSIDRQGQASCHCPPPCEAVMRPVCGDDGRQYDNECDLKRKACLSQRRVIMVSPGPCAVEEPCRSKYCDYDSVCVVKDGIGRCDCPSCAEQSQLVCGDDGISYMNECKLRQENCQKKRTVRIWHAGMCNGCDDKECNFYSVCEHDGHTARCVCPTSCVDSEAQVCGDDGKTYQNECELRVASCKQRHFIRIVSIGACDSCSGIRCRFGAKCENGHCVCPGTCVPIYEPLCASNLNTYQNECEMRKDACKKSVELDITHFGECDEYSGSGEGSGGMMDCDEMSCQYGGTCQSDHDGFYTCSCNLNCDAIRSLVCGSDGKTYGNQCQLQEAACQQQQEIREESMDRCDVTFETEACDGSKALVNPRTGYDYDCRRGKEVCPADSYCHEDFGKCCREDTARDCTDSQYGCCSDGFTLARGVHNGGCPSYCQCNPIGSFGTTCDPVSRQCSCKPGVGGLRCDRCRPGFWGLKLIEEKGNAGCIPCGCHSLGSQRDDCDQMLGRCVCKPRFRGIKCNRCSDNSLAGPSGCDGGAYIAPKSCQELDCKFGSQCQEYDDYAECRCDVPCGNTYNEGTVCGTDDRTYGSECEMLQFSCRNQRHISLAYHGQCTGAGLTTPMPPTTRSRKTTRHIARNETSNKVTKITAPKSTEKPPVESKSHPFEHVKDQPVQHSYGKIGDLCSEDDHCMAPNSRCRLALCECIENFIPTMENTKCSEVKASPGHVTKADDSEMDPCTINPCMNDGKCELDHSLGYRCLCPLGKTGPICKEDVIFTTPSFSGKSFLRLRKIEDANTHLLLEAVFSPFNQDGIVLFTAQKEDGSGDFISLAVKDGFVEFRFDLGSGRAMLKSKEQLSLNQYHRVVARRTGQDGVLIVDDGQPVTGSSPPSLKSLDLELPLFVGYVPGNSSYEKIGVSMGLVGCIQSLKVGGKDTPHQYNLNFGHSLDILAGEDIGECGNNPCRSLPCFHGSTCIMLDSKIFQCICKEGYSGETCEIMTDPCTSNPCDFDSTCEMTSTEEFICHCPEDREGKFCENEKLKKAFVPQFSGDSFLKIPLDANIGRQMSIEIWFMANDPNGMLLFGSQFIGGLGDFISLNLVDRYLQFRFDLGSGRAIIRSSKQIQLSKWHRVVIQRLNKDGDIILDGDTPDTGRAQGNLNELNLGRPLYIGGFKDKFDLPLDSGIDYNFTGAIQRVYVNGRLIDFLLDAAEEAKNIEEYEGPPCNVNPCFNGGVCVPRLSDADCKCPKKYMGERCGEVAELLNIEQPVKFTGDTFLEYPNEVSKKQPAQLTNKFEIRFRTQAKNGLLVFQNKGSNVMGDYLAIAIVNSKVELSYNLGKQTESDLHIIRSTLRVDDGQWHSILAERDKRIGMLQVDKEARITVVSARHATQLDTDGLLWIGGKSKMPVGLPAEYATGFKGCIEEVRINNEKLHLYQHQIGHSNVVFCD